MRRLTNPFVRNPSCVLCLPFYRYGAEQAKVWDLSGNNNHGVIHGAGPELHPILIGSGVVGYESRGWGFDGVDDYIDLGAGAWANITSDVTIVGWIRPATYVGSHAVVRKGYSQSPFNLCLVGTDLRFYYTVGSSWGGVDSPLSTPEGRWLCIAATRSFSGTLATLKLFENGNLISSGTRNGVPDSTAQGASIGYDNSGGDYLYGSVGEVLIFGRALAPQEIRDYYEVTRHRYGSAADTTLPYILAEDGYGLLTENGEDLLYEYR